MAVSIRMMALACVGSSSSTTNSSYRTQRVRYAISCTAAAGGLRDQYRILRIQPGASQKEVKKAFRRLALQYHPDVCKESNCSVKFHQINEAYDMVISSLRESEEEGQYGSDLEWANNDDQMRGMNDPSWDLWEEWMGWEGAGMWDYSSHINPYI